MLPLHELVKGHVPKAGIPIVILRPDDGNGITLVGLEEVASETPFFDAGLGAAYDGVDEEEDEVFVVE